MQLGCSPNTHVCLHLYAVFLDQSDLPVNVLIIWANIVASRAVRVCLLFCCVAVARIRVCSDGWQNGGLFVNVVK